jgi:hypothetical protein
MAGDTFSKRHGYTSRPKEISIWEDAPQNLRYIVLEAASECGLSPSTLRAIICKVLRTPPDSNNWSVPNVWGEVEQLIYQCDWFRVYDFIEAIHAYLLKAEGEQYGFTSEAYGQGDSAKFADAINSYCLEEGIGWQLEDGQIATRGSQAFEAAVHTAVSELQSSGRPTAATRIQEALNALSRRPEPDLAGAITHAIAALECVMGDITGDPKATLGDFLKKYPDLEGSLKKALEGLWGYANNEGARHGKEGVVPKREEAELVVGIAASVVTYLGRKNK